MMMVVLSLLAFVAVMTLFLGLSAPLHALNEEAKRADFRENALTTATFGPLVRFFSYLNRRDSLGSYHQNIERKLLLAGKPGGSISGFEFLAAAEIAGLAAFLVMTLLLSLAGGLTALGLVVGGIFGVIGVWFPHLWLASEVNNRRKIIQRQFPFFLDLGVMTMGAGSSFQETTEIYCRDNPKEALAAELRVMLGEVRMGRTLSDGLEGLRDRIDLEEVKATANALIQGQRLGTPLNQVLREQADVMRFKRSQNAERMAEELKVRMQGPTMMMMIAVFFMILGPAFVEMLQGGLF
ncbi:MAG: type II secretion system F family protein [Deltaproteobacteria bacterium]|nr:type II secretion system F family protein [Deltaproteobacteria bacterium]